MVSDIYPGLSSSNPDWLVLAQPDGPLFFAAEEPVAGREIWQLTTPTGTPELLADIAPAQQSSFPEFLAIRNLSLVFMADDGTDYAMFELSDVVPDVTPPTITCPDDISITIMNPGGTAVSYPPPVVEDDSGDAPMVSADWSSGDSFPIGVTEVTITAEDGAGNTSQCSFFIEVLLDLPDAGVPDASIPDASIPDASIPDAGVADSGVDDAGPDGTDASVDDAGIDSSDARVDAGPVGEPSPGCGCATAGGNTGSGGWLLFLLGIGVLSWRRDRDDGV